MAGRAHAVSSGSQLASAVAALGEALGLETHRELKVGRRLWGAERRIDVVLIHKQTRKALGVECKYQGGSGSAEEKIPSTIQDIEAWPIGGLVVFAGAGFSANMQAYLHSTGKAVNIADLETWLRLYFGLPLDRRVSQVRKGELVVDAPLMPQDSAPD
jgi:hypothetical protein